MTFALVTTIWKRPRLTELMLRWYAGLVGPLRELYDIELVLVAVGSQRWRSRRQAERAGWRYLEAPNQPLSDKFNIGIRFLAGFTTDPTITSTWRPDAVVIVGSDDFASVQCFTEARRLIEEEGAQYVIPNGLHFLDAQTRRACYVGTHNTGTFRVLTRELLDALDWRPYIAGALKGIDRTMDDRVRQTLGTDRYSVGGPMALINTNPGQDAVVLDVKNGFNMWSFGRMAESVTGRYVELDFLQAFGQTGADLLELNRWRSRRYWRRLTDA